MMKVYSFPWGGFSFKDPAVPPGDSSVTAFLPNLSVISLTQHSGGEAYPVVMVGDPVKEGALVGRGRGKGSANVHATVPGKVVSMVSWEGADGQTNNALAIRMEGSFEKLGKREDVFPWTGLSPYELQRLVSEYGVVEMEGSGLPLADIVSELGSSPESLTLVVRCVFDDPWLAADYVLCRERLKEVVEGSVIAAVMTNARHIVFAFSHRERELGDSFLAEARNYDIPVSLVLTGSRYPQRNRWELELTLRDYEKKESLALDSLLMLGPATLAAVHDAVKFKRPVLDRYVAVGGSAVKHPQVMKVRIGKRIGEVFAECGGFIEKPKRIATGSPLLGRQVVDLDEPIVKTSFAVFAVLKNQLSAAPQNCISCGECRMVCPVGLDPEELFKKIESGNFRPSLEGHSGECHGCGCCDVVCPSRLPLSGVILDAAGKGS
jgi:electron transport complex protein RnfC